MLGNQSIKVLQLLSKLLQQSSKSFLLCWYVFVKPLWPKLQTRYSSLQGFQKWSDSDGRHATNEGNMWKVSYKPLKMFGYQTCHVFPQLDHVFFCHVWRCRRLDENNGIWYKFWGYRNDHVITFWNLHLFSLRAFYRLLYVHLFWTMFFLFLHQLVTCSMLHLILYNEELKETL